MESVLLECNALVTVPELSQKDDEVPSQVRHVSSTFMQMVEFVCGGDRIRLWM